MNHVIESIEYKIKLIETKQKEYIPKKDTEMWKHIDSVKDEYIRALAILKKENLKKV